MHSIRDTLLPFFTVLLLLQGCQADPYREAVNDLAKPYLEQEYLVGVSIGILTPEGQYTYHFGQTQSGGPIPTDETLYEIGSITKTMTGLMLADGVTRGRYDVDEPVASLLGDGIEVDERITLRRLSTHTSGLTRLPSNMFPSDPRNPYAAYSEQHLLAFLKKPSMQSEPGTEASYSNIGVGLLGYALAKHEQTSYEDLLKRRVLKPLGMDDTTITLDHVHENHMAQPHTTDGALAHLWDMPTLAGAGGVRANVVDMLAYSTAQIDPDSTPLADAIRLSHTNQSRPGDVAFDAPMGLGWFIGEHATEVSHRGGTGGFLSMLKISLKDRTAVVVLSNSASKHAGTLAKQVTQLVNGKAIDPVNLPKAVVLEQAVLEQYVGHYKLLDLGFIEIELDGDKLYTRQNSQKRNRLFPESKTSFRNRATESTVRFDRDKTGEVTGLTLIQYGHELTCPRVVKDQNDQD